MQRNKSINIVLYLLTQYSINIVLEVLATATGQEKEIKGMQIGRKKVKLSLFADNMILYIQNPKISTLKLLELMNEISKFIKYNITMQKSVIMLNTNNSHDFFLQNQNKKY